MAKLELRLRSWIPDNKVTFLGRTFGGDNRKDAMWSTLAYRLSQSFVIDTSTPTYTVSMNRKINPTTEYYSDGTSKTFYQDADAIYDVSYRKIYVKETDALHLLCVASVANPAVKGAPTVDYTFDIKVTRPGSVRIIGHHDGYPNFEFWRKIEGKASGPELIYNYKHGNKGPSALAAPAEMSVDVGRSYTA